MSLNPSLCTTKIELYLKILFFHSPLLQLFALLSGPPTRVRQ